MCISGTELSDPLPNKVVEKMKNNAPKVPKEAIAKKDGVINPQNYNFYLF